VDWACLPMMLLTRMCLQVANLLKQMEVSFADDYDTVKLTIPLESLHFA
jgi:hypothetical protein